MPETLRQMTDAVAPLVMAALVAVALESFWPWRRTRRRGLRWLQAAVLYLTGTVLAYVVVPAGSFGVAIYVEHLGWGLLNRPELPAFVAMPPSLALLDLTQWTVHRALHRSPRLWRLHRVHHSDTDIDASTALRFHPGEVSLRVAAGSGVVALAGVPPEAVIAMGVLVLVFDFWDHVNLPLPPVLRPLGLAVITPELHRLHHSTSAAHQQRNLGTVLTLWDWLAGSYLPAAELTDSTRFGLGDGSAGFDRLSDLLLDPARSGGLRPKD